MDWDDVRFFLAVARDGTLARAARRLRVDPTTAGRRIAVLEKNAGARLFDRTPDGWLLTDAGQVLLVRAERMESEALAIEREVAGADSRTDGVVRLTVTEMLATRFIAPHLPRFHKKNPGIELRLFCTNKVLNLGRREADIALRLSRPREEDLVVRRLATIPMGVYAAKSYVEAFGKPADAEQSLAGHRVLMFASIPAFDEENAWMEPRIEGSQVVLRSDSVSSLYAACLAGLGIALLPCVVADSEPLLERLPTRSSPEERAIWQSVHKDLKDNARVRVVLDFLGKALTPRMVSARG